MWKSNAINKEVCSNCKKEIVDDEAIRCLFYGESLNRPFGFMGKIKYSNPKIILVIIIVVVLLCFFMFIM